MQFKHLLATAVAITLAASGGVHAAKPAPADAAPADVAVSVLGRSVLVDVLANDGPVGSELKLRRVSAPLYGHAHVEGAAVRYVPAPGFTGTDTFQYVVQAKGAAPRKGEVIVHVSTGGAIVTIDGRVSDGPIVDATVAARLSGIDFVAPVDADGRFRLTLASVDNTQMVQLDASGGTASGGVGRYVSTLGSLAQLSRMAGADEVLTQPENDQVNLTAVSSAHQLLLEQANRGSAPESHARLHQLLQHVDLERLVRIAAVLQLASDGAPLPAGVSSAFQLASDSAAMAAFESSLKDGQLDAARSAIRAGAGSTSGFTAGRIPAGYAFLIPSAPGTIRVGSRGQTLLQLHGTDGGATSGVGSYVTEDFRQDVSVGWVLSGGRIQVTLAQPVETMRFPFNSCYRQDRERAALTALDLVRLRDGEGLDYIAIEHRETVTVEDLNPTDACVPGAPYTRSYTWQMLGFEEGNGELAYSAPDLSTERLLPAVASQYGLNAAVAWGSLAIPLSEPQRAASLHNGRLRYLDPATNLFYEVRRYQTDGRKGEGVMAVAFRADRARAVRFDLSVARDPLLAISSEGMVGQYDGGFGVSSVRKPDSWLLVRVQPTGAPFATGEYEETFIDAQGGSVRRLLPFSWTVNGPGVWKADSYSQWFAPTTVAYCTVGVNGCYVARTREWLPMARDGDRVYVAEHLKAFSPSGQVTTNSSRGNFYDQLPAD